MAQPKKPRNSKTQLEPIVKLGWHNSKNTHAQNCIFHRILSRFCEHSGSYEAKIVNPKNSGI